MKINVIDNKTGEIVEISIKTPKMRSYNTATQIRSNGEINRELSLFVPGQTLELGEIIARSARGMDIPIVTRQGVYISKSIDDEIDVLDKFDRDLTDYTKALLQYRKRQEDIQREQIEKQRKKDELYNNWLQELKIQKDNQPTQEDAK